VSISLLPHANVVLNSMSALALLGGFAAVRSQRVALHRAFMLSAFILSTIFLASYLTYHAFGDGPVRYLGDHRSIYLAVLISHIATAPLILPLAITTLLRGIRGKKRAHRSIAPLTLGMWLYCSVTGVFIYCMLYL